MNNRRIFCQPEAIIEIVEPTGLSALKIRVLRGARGNTQVLVYSQPGCRVTLDPPQSALSYILGEDLQPEEFPS